MEAYVALFVRSAFVEKLALGFFLGMCSYDFTESLVYGIGSGAGWALALIGLAGIREKLKYSDFDDIARAGRFLACGAVIVSWLDPGQPTYPRQLRGPRPPAGNRARLRGRVYREALSEADWSRGNTR